MEIREIKNIIALVLFGFIASFGLLNFDYFQSELSSLAGNITGINDEVNIFAEKNTSPARLFPISAEKVIPSIVIKKISPPTVTTIASVKTDYRLSVPILGIEARIVFEPTTYIERIYSALEKGVVHYAKTPNIGELGTAIIIGHSSSYPWYKGKFGSIFSNLSKLKTGDKINIQKNGEILNYTVTKSIIFSPNNADDFELRELESTSGSSLVLMTCWPTGTNAKRVAVRADLVI